MTITQTARIADARRLRADCFTTRTLSKSQKLAFWRRQVSSLITIEPTEDDSWEFDCTARGYDLGDMHLASTRMSAMRYARTPAHIRSSAIDHWSIGVIKRGGDISLSDDRTLRSLSGDVQIKSLACPMTGTSTAMEGVTLYLARDRFPELADTLDAANHTTLSGVMSGVLRESMLALERHVRGMTVAEVSSVVTSFAHLIAAAVRPCADTARAARQPIAASRFSAARQLIEENLASPDLGPDWLARTLGMSRRQLYYLFEAQGGVVKFILRRRLAACCRAVADRADTRLISTIAYSYGFTDAGVFSRQFLAEFGFRPSEARDALLAGHLPRASAPASFSEWLLQGRSKLPARLAA